MATAPKNSPSDGGRSLLECPVCVSTFRNPKSLRCGHSVCVECCQQLRTSHQITCPVCRTKTQVPSDGLPTNFALQDLIEHHVTLQSGKKYACSLCNRRYLVDDSWICLPCNSALICANCAIKDHRGHDLQTLAELINNRREELAEWRQRMEGTVREVDAQRCQIDANLVRVEQRSMHLNAILRTKLEPRFAEAVHQLNAERDAIFKAIHEVDVSDIIGAASGDSSDVASARSHSQFENQLNEVPQKLDALKVKQEQILADQRLALEVVQNCSEVLRQIIITPPKNADGGRQQSTQPSPATPAEEPRFPFGQPRRSESRFLPPQLSRRGRIFPPLDARGDGIRMQREFTGSGRQQRNHPLWPFVDAAEAEDGNMSGRMFFSPPQAARSQPEGRRDESTVNPRPPEGIIAMEPEVTSQAAGEITPAAEPGQWTIAFMSAPTPASGGGAHAAPMVLVDVDMDVVSDEEAQRLARNSAGGFPTHGLGGFGRGAPVDHPGGYRRDTPRPVDRARGYGRGTPIDRPDHSSPESGSSLGIGRGQRVPPVVFSSSIQPMDQTQRGVNVTPGSGNGESGSVGGGAATNMEDRIRFGISDSSEDDDTDAMILFASALGGESRKSQS